MKIVEGTVVTFDYELHDGEARLLDRSRLTYVHGEKRLIPALESTFAGREPGERFELALPPEQAYGFHDPALIENVPLTRLESRGPLEVGSRFQTESPEGMRVATVIAIEGFEARLDMNHPLAGLELHFAVEIVDVRAGEPPHTH